jgi:hypothetical protein
MALALPAWGQATPDPASAPPICTDRPTKSNVPCTVDAGSVQYEADLANATFSDQDGVKTDTWLLFNPTLKYGLTPTLDVEANIAADEVVQTQGPSGGHTESGVGDLYLRLKYAFLDVDKGALTASIIPYLKAPTARVGLGDGAVEEGAIMPVSYKLTSALTLTTAPEVDVLRDAQGEGRHVNTAQLVNLALSLPGAVTLYGELWGDWNLDPAGEVSQVSADAAAAWAVTPRLQLDAGANFGLNRATPGVQVYVGISQKF